MEQLFRLTELEVRVPLNLNVIDPAGVPRVMNLKEALQAFLDHRREVLQRKSRHRLAAVARRIEILRGLVIVYVNLDEVIRIIREADDAEDRDDGALGPQRGPGRGDPQHAAARVAPARGDRDPEGADELAGEAAALDALLASDQRQWRASAKEVAATAGRVRRRHRIGRPPHPHRQRARAGRDPAGGARRARGGDRAVLAEGLDPRGQGPCNSPPPSRNTRKATGRALRSRPRPPTGSSSSAATGGSTRSPSTACPADAARASHCD